MRISLDDDDFKNAFLSGKLVIDCTEIKLTQHDTDHPRIYIAPGFMEVSPQDGVKIRMVCKREANDRYNPFAMKYSEVEAGVLLSKKYFYKLEVTDVYGNLWTNEEVDINEHHYPESISIDVACKEIQTVSFTEFKKTYANFIFKEDLEFPINTKESRKITKYMWSLGGDSWTLSTGIMSGINIFYDPRKYDAGEKYVDFFAQYEDGVNPIIHFEDRLLESIRFCIAKFVHPIMSSVCVDGEIRIILRKDSTKHGFIKKPVPAEYRESDHFYKLFECYFNYACNPKWGKGKSPVSIQMTTLFSLENTYFETQILLLSIAIEGILKVDFFKDIVKPNTDTLESLKKIKNHLMTLEKSELLNRAINSVTNLGSISTSDKLYCLRDIGVLSEDEIKSWKSIRHSSAHGAFDMSGKDFQEYHDKSFKLITVIYKLIFMCIGYSGKYNNYSTRGWSVADFDIDKYKAVLDGSGLR